jgi:hypothetical protein
VDGNPLLTYISTQKRSSERPSNFAGEPIFAGQHQIDVTVRKFSDSPGLK